MQTSAQANDFIANLKSSAKNPLQPIIYFVGDSQKEKDIKATIMIVNTFYLFEDIIKAVDMYFAIIIAGKFYFPHQSENLFKLLELAALKSSRKITLPSSFVTFLNELTFNKQSETTANN